MKNVFLGSLLIFSLFLSGCQSPLVKWIKGEKAVTSTKQEITKLDNKLQDDVISYIYGADFALSLNPTNNIYTSTAKKMTEKALVVSGPPPMSEVNRLQQIIRDLTSTNAQNIIRGEKELANKDAEVILAQGKIDKLQEKLVVQEEKLKDVNKENATLASKWARLVSIFWWIVWVAVIGLVLSILGRVLPPPYNNIVQIISIPISFIVKFIIGLMPSIKKTAGVVSTEIHDLSHGTLEKLVLSIQELKKSDPEAYASLQPILKEKINPDINSPVIDAIKKDYSL